MVYETLCGLWLFYSSAQTSELVCCIPHSGMPLHPISALSPSIFSETLPGLTPLPPSPTKALSVHTLGKERPHPHHPAPGSSYSLSLLPTQFLSPAGVTYNYQCIYWLPHSLDCSSLEGREFLSFIAVGSGTLNSSRHVNRVQ